MLLCALGIVSFSGSSGYGKEGKKSTEARDVAEKSVGTGDEV